MVSPEGGSGGFGADYPSDLQVVNFLSDAKILASRVLQLDYVRRVTASERLVEKLFAVENNFMFFNQSLDSCLLPPLPHHNVSLHSCKLCSLYYAPVNLSFYRNEP